MPTSPPIYLTAESWGIAFEVPAQSELVVQDCRPMIDLHLGQSRCSRKLSVDFVAYSTAAYGSPSHKAEYLFQPKGARGTPMIRNTSPPAFLQDSFSFEPNN